MNSLLKNSTKLLSLACLASTAPLLQAADARSFTEAVAQGKTSLKLRARYENVDQSGLRDANALTLRTALSFTTATWEGLAASVEVENVASPEGDAYSQAGLNTGGAGKAVVADPEGTEVNQAWLSFTGGKTTLKVGRQQLIFDNARFVGNVGWRQNNQTYDAISLLDKSVENLTLNYAYLERINRIFGDRHAQGRWDSNSHLVNASWSGLKAGTLTAYAYLLDFDNAAANSCATYGASFAGATPLSDDLKLQYRAELATQSDYGSSSLNYSAAYYAVELGLAAKQGGLGAGYEVLGSDNTVGFKTPLATLHAFNGWADLFLATPAGGLEDLYAKANLNLPEGFKLAVFYHDFRTQKNSSSLGNEVDAVLSKQVTKQISALVKFAQFNSKSSLADVRKLWIQVDTSF